MRLLPISASVLLATLVATLPAAAKTENAQVYRAVTGPELAEIVRQAGYMAKLGRDNLDDPMITSQAHGVQFSIYFYGCDNTADEACGSITFNAYLDPSQEQTVDQMNAWNATSRLARASVNDEGNVTLSYDLDLSGGVTAETIATALAMWNGRYEAFLNHIGWPR